MNVFLIIIHVTHFIIIEGFKNLGILQIFSVKNEPAQNYFYLTNIIINLWQHNNQF